jgi:hypothetical protein
MRASARANAESSQMQESRRTSDCFNSLRYAQRLNCLMDLLDPTNLNVTEDGCLCWTEKSWCSKIQTEWTRLVVLWIMLAIVVMAMISVMIMIMMMLMIMVVIGECAMAAMMPQSMCGNHKLSCDQQICYEAHRGILAIDPPFFTMFIGLDHATES